MPEKWKEPGQMTETSQPAVTDRSSQAISRPSPSLPPESRRQHVFQQATAIFQRSPDWASFVREVLGVDGTVRQAFRKPEELEAFEQSEEFIQIQQMVARLRERSKHQSESSEPTRVITVRLPKCLHELLRAEAHQRQTSMNQLCISKLLQMVDNELVPSE
jgi:predicted HicB family RNase H-like nuclease